MQNVNKELLEMLERNTKGLNEKNLKLAKLAKDGYMPETKKLDDGIHFLHGERFAILQVLDLVV